MKISTFILLIGILCIFYIYNAEWIDEWYETFVEDYVGSDYEEVAPFVSSGKCVYLKSRHKKILISNLNFF